MTERQPPAPARLDPARAESPEARTFSWKDPADFSEQEARLRRLQIVACMGPPGLARIMADIYVEQEAQRAAAVTCAPDTPAEQDTTAASMPSEVPLPRSVGRWGHKARMDTCIHEAGHAVAHWYVGVPFGEIRVCSRREPPFNPEDGPIAMTAGAVSGFALVPPRRDWLARAAAGDAEALARGRAATEMEMFCAYAGPLADAGHTRRYILRRPGEQPIRRYWRLDAESILHGGGGEGDWALIETDIADWPEGIAMAARARRLAQAFVRGRAAWDAIQELARTVSLELRLGWAEVDAIVRRHFGRPSPGPTDWMLHWPPLAMAVRAGSLPPRSDGIPPARPAPPLLPAAPRTG